EKQCQSLANGNPCYYEKVEGSEYCAMHGGQTAVRVKRKQEMYDLRKSKWLQKLADDKLDDFGKGKNKFNMSEELGILRIVLQEILGQCTDTTQLMRHNQKISNTISQIERLISSSLKLDQKLGQLVTKDEMLAIAQALIECIQTEIKDAQTVKNIVENFEKILNDKFVSRSPG
ncbi:MAG: hypothetical protein QQN65_06015, partial [Nitrosopumilus sp.]